MTTGGGLSTDLGTTPDASGNLCSIFLARMGRTDGDSKNLLGIYCEKNFGGAGGIAFSPPSMSVFLGRLQLFFSTQGTDLAGNQTVGNTLSAR